MTSNRRSKGNTSQANLKRELLDAVGSLLTQVRSALFITGPALSADSGLLHYRGVPGLVRRKPEDGKVFEAGLAIETLRAKPNVTWGLLLEMDARVREAAPNRGHEFLVRLERELPRVTIMTINVDRLHQRAGSRNVIEMHGALHDLLCSRCELSTRHESFGKLRIPPQCKACGTVLRPDMPLFGEALPADPFTRLQAELDEGFDIVFSIGISTMFPYIARPLLVAKSEGIPTVEIGPQPTDLSEVVDFRFRGSPMRVLDLIADVYGTIVSRRSQPSGM
ncbi:MAG: NAD-dependent protein deacylase [Deltaproteobacteria bacterium]|nr:NAD-dependent protein deacylase [Deltaproteobacteria bacterium]